MRSLLSEIWLTSYLYETNHIEEFSQWEIYRKNFESSSDHFSEKTSSLYLSTISTEIQVAELSWTR